jgi:hypothetical protein
MDREELKRLTKEEISQRIREGGSCKHFLRVLLDPNPWGVKKEGALWTPTDL